jgi:hypothetical protein
MKPFRIETRLDQSGYGYGHSRLSTRINIAGQEELNSNIEIGMIPDARMLDYILEKHFHDIKQFILGQARDQLFKESPEYQRMQRELDDRDRKLDNIADISDPDERG